MNLTETEFGPQPPIDGYGAGFFRVQGQIHKGSLLILPGGITPWTGLEDLKPLAAGVKDIDVLFLGMGKTLRPLPADTQRQFARHKIHAELMNSPAACRTYNVLLGEGRRVGLAALPI